MGPTTILATIRYYGMAVRFGVAPAVLDMEVSVLPRMLANGAAATVDCQRIVDAGDNN
jgi:hypothetical protein